LPIRACIDRALAFYSSSHVIAARFTGRSLDGTGGMDKVASARLDPVGFLARRSVLGERQMLPLALRLALIGP
jgi:hypothetical protein